MATQALSSYYYIRAILKEGDGEKVQIPIKTKRSSCGHETTICSDCLDEWAQDWDLLLDNTAGGRALKGGSVVEKLDASGFSVGDTIEAQLSKRTLETVVIQSISATGWLWFTLSNGNKGGCKPSQATKL